MATDVLATAARAERSLRAGPLTCLLRATELADVRVDGRLVVTRLGVKVRDTAWGTVRPRPAVPEVDMGPAGGFAARLGAHHGADGLAFGWTAAADGDVRGALCVSMLGVAEAPIAFNRIGLCVLHAAEACAGAAFRARSGRRTWAGALPRLVGPQPMDGERVLPLVEAFTELELDLADGLRLRFAFEGDVFEMEDQRNWADGSFKTYSTPVGDPVPHHLETGEQIRQAVRMEVVRRPRGGDGRRRGRGADVKLGPALGFALPPVGLGLDHDGHVPSHAELAQLRRVRPAHLRCDVRPGERLGALQRGLEVARALGTGLELALTLDAADPARGLDALPPALAHAGPALHRVIVLRAGARRTDPADVVLVRERLGAAAPVPLLLGTDRYFAELNRDRPAMGAADGLAYPITPQVHDSDDQALVESLPGQADTVLTARSFAGGRPVHVSPLTLKPRWNPFATAPDPVAHGALPPEVDPRQSRALAAAWLTASLARLARAGAASITCFELTGWRGIVERETGTPVPERFASRPGQPFPVLEVLARVAGWGGGELLEATCATAHPVEVLAVRGAGGTLGALVANLHDRPATIRLRPFAGRWATVTPAGPAEGAGNRVSLAPWGVVHLQEAA